MTWFPRVQRDTLLTLLSELPVVGITVEPRQGVLGLPERWQKEDSVTLHVGYRLPVPIADLKVDESGVSGTFSFDRTPYPLTIPWRAVTLVCDPHDDSHLVFFHTKRAVKDLPVPPQKDKPKSPFTVIQGGKQ